MTAVLLLGGLCIATVAALCCLAEMSNHEDR